MRTLLIVTLLAVLLHPSALLAQKSATQKAPPKTLEIKIADIHDGDATVRGNSPVSNIALTIKVNGKAGANTVNSNSSGDFTFALATNAVEGNFVEVSGTSGDSQLYGSATVVAPPVKLGKPSVGAKLGDNFVTVTRNSADAGIAGLSIHLSEGTATTPDCVPDDTSGQCQIFLNKALKAGDTISVQERASAVSGPEATATIPAAPALAKPALSGPSEGEAAVSVTADKGDLGRSGLRVQIRVTAQNGTITEVEKHVCVPDSASGQCSVKTGTLRPDEVVEAIELADDSAPGPAVESRVTARASLGKPSIKPVQEGDDTITVSLNGNDKQPGISIAVAFCYIAKPCTPLAAADGMCNPDDTSGSCPAKLPKQVLAGDTIQAWEMLKLSAPAAADGIATSVVAPRATLALPIVAPVKETDTTVKVTLDANDFKQWGGNLTFYLTLFNSGDPIANKKCTPTAGDDNCAISLDAPLAAGQVLHINVAAVRAVSTPATLALPNKPGPELMINVPELGFDWGRVRAYFSLGSVFSRYTTATPAGGGTSATSTNNFSSPDIFAGLDMDFNWYSGQRCLAYPFGDEHVKLTTVADAAAQCGRRGGSGSRGEYRTRSQASLSNLAKQRSTSSGKSANPMEFTSDRSLLSMIEFLYSIDEKNKQYQLPPRLAEVKAALNKAADDMAADPINRDHIIGMAQAYNQLRDIELTPQEVQEVLTQFGYERIPQHGWMVNSYVLNRLTQTSASNGFTLSNSSNSLHLEGGIYTPWFFGWSRWPYKGEPHALFVAPIAKLGFDSLRQSGTDEILQQTPAGNYANAVAALSKDIYRMMAFGGRLGMFTFSSTPNRAPEQIMYVDFTYGRYDNFFTQKYGDTTGAVRYPWRFGMNSRLKIPGTIFFIGADMTKGVGPDDLQFYVGGRADLSALFSKLFPSLQK